MSLATPVFIPVSTSATLYVDGVYGTSGGIRGNRNKPFQTITQAVGKMSPGDLIDVVAPGTYTDTNIWKMSMALRGCPGADIAYAGSGSGGIIDDGPTGANASATLLIDWPGKIIQGSTATDDLNNTISMRNSGSIIRGRIGVIFDNTANGGEGQAISAIRQGFGTLELDTQEVNSSHGSAYWWGDGPGYLSAKIMSGGDLGAGTIYSAPAGAQTSGISGAINDSAFSGDSTASLREVNHMVVDCARIVSTTNSAIQTAGSNNARAWIKNFVVITQSGTPNADLVYLGANFVYMIGMKVDGQSGMKAINVFGGATFYPTIQKVACGTNGLFVGNATCKGRINAFEDTNNYATDMMVCDTSAAVYLSGDTAKGGTGANGITHTGGNAVWKDFEVDTSASTTANPVKLSAAGCVLGGGLYMTSNGSRSSVIASTSQTITVDPSVGANNLHDVVHVTKVTRSVP